jgi:predicted RNase H-like HicB family nuclease
MAGIITEYMDNAIREAQYEKIEDGQIYGSLPSCPGVWAEGETIKEVRKELREALEMWIVLKLKDNDPMPEIGGVKLGDFEEAEDNYTVDGLFVVQR